MQEEPKLDDKSKKYIFVRYGDRSMGYKLYNPITKKVILSKDVVFEEDKTWKWNDDQEAIKQVSTYLILEDEVEVPTVLAEGPILPTDEPQSPAHRQGSPPRFHTYANPNLRTILSFKQLNHSSTQH